MDFSTGWGIFVIVMFVIAYVLPDSLFGDDSWWDGKFVLNDEDSGDEGVDDR